ncbi:TetR-like C-terminal domain-containing protein [Nocardia fluminea]|uniref:TetR-like C-terminal domain-containing protein n=1 Tax=Nocardia fluminea TaxID=134984 RepID=UPI00366C14B9
MVIDAFVEAHLPLVRISGDLPVREALEAHVKSLIARYAGPQGRLIAQIIAEGQYDQATLVDFKARFWNDRNAAVDKLIRRGIEGLFRSDIEPHDAAEMIYAPIYFHLLFSSGPLDDALGERLVDQAILGLGA